MQLILGSQSPRRKEIISFFGLPFEQISSTFDEEAVPYDGNPTEYAKTLSRGKAENLALKHPKALILTADTIVEREGKLYGKPRDKAEGFAFLKELTGHWHNVYTAVTVIKDGKELSCIELTRVLFNSLTDHQIDHYLESLHCYDKAGSYAIQQSGGLIVQKIDGCYYNVMGLPINTVWRLLKEFDIDLWDHIQ